MLRQYSAKIIGLIGSLAVLFVYIQNPSFPTPDKLLVFVVCVGLIFGQAIEAFKRLAPFVLLLAAYDAFRGIADYLNTNVHYMMMPFADKMLFFGQLPTHWLQSHLWDGSVGWFEMSLYIAYMLHFVFPVTLAIIVWKLRVKHYWRVVGTYVLLSFAGFFTFVLFPAAPPWMAAEKGYIEPMTRISSSVWSALGVHDFPSVYNQISPNPVAAVPSLHAAYATLFCLFIFQLFKGRWRYVTLLYPAAIYFGTVYMGEHYAVDELLGGFYAYVAFIVAAPAWNITVSLSRRMAVASKKRIGYAYSYLAD